MLGGNIIFKTGTGKAIINNINFVNKVISLFNMYSNNKNKYIRELDKVFSEKFGRIY